LLITGKISPDKSGKFSPDLTIERRRHLFGGIALALFVLLAVCLAAGNNGFCTSGEIFQAYAWSAILFLTGWFKKHVNRSGPVARYLARSSFMFYVLHQSALVLVAFYIVRMRLPLGAEIPLIIVAGYALTFAAYELWRRLACKTASPS
jgi:peptidoglycan/LPS O-acetylase OafA/YrhL